MANLTQNRNYAAVVAREWFQRFFTALMVLLNSLWLISLKLSLCRILWLGTLVTPGLCWLLNDDGLAQLWLSWVPLVSPLLDHSDKVFVLLTHGWLDTECYILLRERSTLWLGLMTINSYCRVAEERFRYMRLKASWCQTCGGCGAFLLVNVPPLSTPKIRSSSSSSRGARRRRLR